MMQLEFVSGSIQTLKTHRQKSKTIPGLDRYPDRYPIDTQLYHFSALEANSEGKTRVIRTFNGNLTELFDKWKGSEEQLAVAGEGLKLELSTWYKHAKCEHYV